MILKQKHRGSNDEGIFSHNSTALGFVRLSILDLSIAGHHLSIMQRVDIPWYLMAKFSIILS